MLSSLFKIWIPHTSIKYDPIDAQGVYLTLGVFKAGHLIECDKKAEIVQYFLGRLCDKLGLLCDKLCDFFRANLHFLTGFKGEKPL